ncbi:actin-like ATPase domain-containing protein [Panus rudis PR-1116 ss-1]|nr:actin-like ATPase domain-containing protein [Panus rudis PR-1116 ss-1]
MSTAFRDSTVVMIDTSRTLIRAGHGLHDLLKTPSVELPAHVGLRRAVLDAANSNTTNGETETEPKASSSKTRPIPVKVTDYLVGSQITEAIAAGQDIVTFEPFAEGDIADWTQAEALWKHVLFNQLGLRRIQMESPVLLTIFPNLSRDTYERLCQTFFERFNVAGFAILERPMAQFYAAITGNELSGVVVDIGERYTDISPIMDGFPIHRARVTVDIGIMHCEHYLAYLLRSNQSVMTTLFPDDSNASQEEIHSTLVELAQTIWRENLIKVLAEGEAADIEEEGVTDLAAVIVAGKEKAVIESGMKNKAKQKASAAEQARAREIEAMDLVQVQFREQTLTLGKERHRFCEPLFDPTLLAPLEAVKASPDTMPLHVAVGHAVGNVDVDHRQYVWQGLLVTGELTNHIKGLGNALQARLAPYILGTADQNNEVQPRGIRVIKVPDYFAEYREKGDGLASFLGSSIVAKLVFTDSSGKNFVSKSDYTEKGPKVILGMSPALL